METNRLYRGRLIDHVQLVVEDLESSFNFYKAVFEALGFPLGAKENDYFWCDELFVSTKTSPAAQGKATGRNHLAFQAKDKEAVNRFYSAAMEAGGKDNGKPGERPYHPGYYAAFVIDPDGNNIEAVYHGPGKRSAASVIVDF